jgi:hypothetical protein
MTQIPQRALDTFRRREVECLLERQLSESREACRIAVRKINDLVAGIPSGLPAPDSDLNLRRRREELERVKLEYARALERWTNFVARGIVPEDLASG